MSALPVKTELEVGLNVGPTEPEAHLARQAMTAAHWQGLLIYRQEVDTVDVDDRETVKFELGPDAWVPDDNQVYHWAYLVTEAAGQHPALVMEPEVPPFVLGLQGLMVAQDMGLITYLRYANAQDQAAMAEVRKLAFGRKKIAKPQPMPEAGGYHLIAVTGEPTRGSRERLMLVGTVEALPFARGLAVAAGRSDVERLADQPWTFLR